MTEGDSGLTTDGDVRARITGLADKIEEVAKATADVALKSEWMPIITAPKDGRKILLCSDDDGIRVAWFSEGCWIFYQNDYEDEDGSLIVNRGEVYPSLWMPLPPPPEKT